MEEQAFLSLFPKSIRELFYENEQQVLQQEEIRLRIHQPVMCLSGKKEEILYHRDGRLHLVTENELKEFLMSCTKQSLYAHEKEFRQGFLTLMGGHRIGVCGEVIMENSVFKNLKHINFMNIRIAHTIYDCGKSIYPFLFENSEFLNTLIISLPGYGKTTLLRDLIRLLSTGDGKQRGYKVGVIDERSEIAACYRGIPQNELGMRTDVYDQCGKRDGIERMVRSMSPEIIAVDELAGRKDLEAVSSAYYHGCSILATAHGKDYKQILSNPEFYPHLKKGLFSRIITISRSENGNFEFHVQNENGELLYTEK